MRKQDVLKLLVAPVFVLGFALCSPSTYATPLDDDGDSVSDVIEQAAPNNGDNNYDGAVDSSYENYQETVASLPNPNDTAAPGSYVTLQVGSPVDNSISESSITKEVETLSIYNPSPWTISTFEATTPPTPQPDGKISPLGMFNIELICRDEEMGCTRPSQACEDSEEFCVEQVPANLKLIFDRVMDTSNWTMLKYNPSTGLYEDHSTNVVVANEFIGYLRTTISWSIYDGGVGDFDNEINGVISDPIGPATPAIATTAAATTNPAIIVASTISSNPTLASTGVSANIIAIIAAIVVVTGFALLPRKA